MGARRRRDRLPGLRRAEPQDRVRRDAAATLDADAPDAPQRPSSRPARPRRSCAAAGTKEIALSTVTADRLVLHHPTAEVYRRHGERADDRRSTTATSSARSQRRDLRSRRRTRTSTSRRSRSSAAARRSPTPVTGTHADVDLARRCPSQRDRHELVAARAPGDRRRARRGRRSTLGRRGDANCDGDVRIAVMGDSYISGEGALRLPARHRRARRRQEPLPPLAEHVAGAARATLVSRGDARTTRRSRPPPPAGRLGRVPGLQRRDDRELRGRAARRRPHAAARQARRRATGTTIDLVFMSIGGNDAGFGDVITTCTAARLRGELAAVAPGRWQRRDALVARATCSASCRGSALNVGGAQRAVRTQAPQAEVYQINYMDPFRPQPPTCGGLSPVGRGRGLRCATRACCAAARRARAALLIDLRRRPSAR